MNELNKNEELDELKSLWSSQQEEKSYDSDKIFRMIHRKSMNSVQWLLIISLIELLAGLIITLWSKFSGKHYYSNSSVSLLGEENIHKLEAFSNTGFIFSLILMAVIFFYYRKISVNSSVSQLIKSIINFRKAIVICLIFIVLIMIGFIWPLYFEVGKNIAIQNINDRSEEFTIERIEKLSRMVGWMVATGATFVISIFFFIYYFVIYGFFLRKLKRNLNSLKEMKEN